MYWSFLALIETMNDGESWQASPLTINEHRCGSNNTINPEFTYNIRLTFAK
jgi:hypothetical protein